MRCMCAPRSLSIHPRCPIHGNDATNVERVQHGMAPQPRTCPKTWRPCGRVECAAYCAGPETASGVATDGGDDADWQPIATAPRDGTNILLAWGQDGVSQGHYVPGLQGTHPWKFIDTNDGITWLINHAVDGPGGPTHWMPMPKWVKATAGVAERDPRCGYPYCGCVAECFAASQPGAPGVATDGALSPHAAALDVETVLERLDFIAGHEASVILRDTAEAAAAMIRAAHGVAPAAPMQGLAAYLRAQASALERSYLSPKDAPHDNIDTLRQWALEVDGASGVREDGRG